MPTPPTAALLLKRVAKVWACSRWSRRPCAGLNRMLATGDLATTIAAVALIRPGPAGSGMKERYVRLAPWERNFPSYRRPASGARASRHPGGASLRGRRDVRGCGGGGADPGRRRRVTPGHCRGRRGRARASLPCFPGPGPRARLCRRHRSGHLETPAPVRAFAFCKAHASGYGVLAWQAAWLKAHYPVEFTAALMNHHAGMYDKRTHLEDAKRRGVKVLLPRSEPLRGRVHRRGGRGAGGAGTRARAVRGHASRGDRGAGAACLPEPGGLSHPRVTRAARGRGHGARGRAGLHRAHPPELLCTVASAFDLYRERGRKTAGDDDLFTVHDGAWPVPSLPEFTGAERSMLEWSVLGLCVREHPMSLFREVKEMAGVVTCREAEERPHRRVRVAGVLAARRTVPTSDGRRMQFVTLEDESGLLECTLFPDVYDRFRGHVRTLGPYVAEGRVEEQYGAPTLDVRSIARCPRPRPWPRPSPGRGWRLSEFTRVNFGRGCGQHAG